MDMQSGPIAALTSFQAEAARAQAEAPAQRLQSARSEAEIDAAAQEFEAVFLAQMMAPMFQGLKTDGPFGGGHGEEIYRGLLVEQYAEEISTRGGVGIAAQIKAELLALQGAPADLAAPAAPIPFTPEQTAAYGGLKDDADAPRRQ
ncbi:MAG: rod-binding protein [Pseudomonadota bacterium]